MNKPLTILIGMCAAGALSATTPALAQQSSSSQSQNSSRYPEGTSNTAQGTSTRSSRGADTADTHEHGSSKIANEAKSSASFVKAAAQDGLMEVELGKLAQTKAQDSQVKEFAQRMVTDHTQANNELERIAKQKGIMVPTSLDKDHQAKVDKIKNKSGKDFDKAYMDLMTKDHKDAVTLFREASTASGVDSELQSFAKKTLPTLEEHQTMAKDAERVAKDSDRSSRKNRATSSSSSSS